MKLSKIYSNDNRFQPIIFNGGFNVIFGDEETKDIHSQDIKTNEHGIGKTSLIHLIDFLLLKKVDKKGFFGKYKDKFSGWVFFLEIQLNNGKYVTIRRSVTTNSRISLKEHYSPHQDYSKELNWDYEDISMNSRILEKNPKNILQNKYLGFDVNSRFNYRSFIPYILRTQHDYQDVFRMTRYNRSHDIDWKPALFELLGFNSDLLEKKYIKDSEIEAEKDFIKKLQGRSNDAKIYTLKAAIEAKEVEKSEIQKLIESFDFYKEENHINIDLVKNIELKIANLNKENYILSHDIEQVKKSLDITNAPSIEMEELKKLFTEMEVYFPENLIKSYDEVLIFSNQITKEREKYLIDELKDNESRKEIVLFQLQDLNKKRGEMLSILNEKDSFIKYRRYQDELVKIESDISIYKTRLDQANTIENLENSLEEDLENLKILTLSIKEELNKDNSYYLEIKRIYQEIYKKTMEHNALALLIVEPNGNGNINFETTILNQSQDLTGQGDGYTSTKVLCSAFILAILICYSDKSFFRFSYNDGLLEGWGRNPKIDFIELIRGYCKAHNIQYIISIIKSDIPNDFIFQEKEIVRILSKNSELFGFKF